MTKPDEIVIPRMFMRMFSTPYELRMRNRPALRKAMLRYYEKNKQRLNKERVITKRLKKQAQISSQTMQTVN